MPPSTAVYQRGVLLSGSLLVVPRIADRFVANDRFIGQDRTEKAHFLCSRNIDVSWPNFFDFREFLTFLVGDFFDTASSIPLRNGN